MDLGDFRTRVSGEIGLSNTAGGSEQALMDGWANDSVVQFLRQTKCYVKPFDMLLTADEDTYDLPSGILSFKELYIVASDGTISPMLEPMSTDEIIYRRRFPTSSGYQPIGYSAEGWNLLLLSSNAVSSSDELHGLYVPRPTKMTDATHDPANTTYGGVPEEFHETLVAFQLWKAATWDDDTSSQIGLAYKADWLEGIKDAKISLNKRAGIRWAPARPGGRRRRRMVPPTPGTDMGQ